MADTVICPTSDIPDNSVKRFEVGNLVLAVYNVDGSFYATDNECTLHFGAFNVKTGAAVQAPCFTPLRTYKCEVKGGQVVVDLDKEAGE